MPENSGINTKEDPDPSLKIVDINREAYFSELVAPNFSLVKSITNIGEPFLIFAGTVRNMIMGIETSLPDYDFIGNFNLDEIESKYPDNVVGRWDNVSTIRLKFGEDIYDLISSENIPATLVENDITVSNICMTEDGQVLDYVGGLESMRKREVKIINPDEKIRKDPSRILRVFRFAAELGFNIERTTLESCISNSKLLESATNLEDDICQILYYEDPSVRTKILESLRLYGIDSHISLVESDLEESSRHVIERNLLNNRFLCEVRRMFDCKALLVGGAIRDLILGKRINDYDLKVDMDRSSMIEILENNGYVLSKTYDTAPGEYYISDFPGVLGFNLMGTDIHMSESKIFDLDKMIKRGDVNMSCCAFSMEDGKIVNPGMMSEIRRKEIKFCNRENALKDPNIVINALKLISKHPDIVIPDETLDIIKKSVPSVVELIMGNPRLRYRIRSLCGNLNSEYVLSFFVGHDEFLKETFKKKEKLIVSEDRYESYSMNEIDKNTKKEISSLVKRQYKSHYDETKDLSENINSVVIERSNGKIVACCLIDGERIYAAAAENAKLWIEIITDLSKNNYNVWGTVDYKNPKIQSLCSIAGLKVEKDPIVIRKILGSKSDKYDDLIFVDVGNGYTFKKNRPDDYPQILLRN